MPGLQPYRATGGDGAGGAGAGDGGDGAGALHDVLHAAWDMVPVADGWQAPPSEHANLRFSVPHAATVAKLISTACFV